MTNFVTEPKIVLVGKMVMDIDGVKEFLADHGYVWKEFTDKLESMMSLGDDDSSWITEMAARFCYQSWAKEGKTIKSRSHEEHIKHLIEVGHGACIEHAAFNFGIYNISRSCSHELVRHRLASYSQLSQRYVDSSDVSFIVPPAIQELKEIDPSAYNEWMNHCKTSVELYERLTSNLSDMYQDIESGLERRKKARQAARSVLPNATETKIFVTLNARAIRHLLELRGSKFADVEIRKLAVKMFNIMQDKAPLFVHGMELVDLDDGTKGVESEFRRV